MPLVSTIQPTILKASIDPIPKYTIYKPTILPEGSLEKQSKADVAYIDHACHNLKKNGREYNQSYTYSKYYSQTALSY